jgi:hypothetical protein
MKGHFQLATATSALLLAVAGCATTDSGSPSTSSRTGNSTGSTANGNSSRFRTDDGRTTDIGKSSIADGGLRFKNPHIEKCWIAAGFDFKGYDALYIAPVVSSVRVKKEEEHVHDFARKRVAAELGRTLGSKGIFPRVITSESEIEPGKRVLKLENTITEFAKGGGAARFWASEFGAGQPVLRVTHRLTDGDKVVFSGESRRSGVSAKARMLGGSMTDEEIQLQDIQSMVLDIGDFISAIAGQYQAKN